MAGPGIRPSRIAVPGAPELRGRTPGPGRGGRQRRSPGPARRRHQLDDRPRQERTEAQPASREEARPAPSTPATDSYRELGQLFAEFCKTIGTPQYDELPPSKYQAALAWIQANARQLLPNDPNAMPPIQQSLL